MAGQTFDTFISALRRHLPIPDSSGGRTGKSFANILAEEGIEPLLTLAGPDQFRIQRAVSWLRETFFPQSSTVFLGTDLTSPSAIAPVLHACSQISLFAPEQLVILYRVDQAKSAAGKELIDTLRKRRPHGVVLFTAVEGGKQKSTFLKELSQLGSWISVPALVGDGRRRWVEKEAARLGGTITPDGARLLADSYPDDLGLISSQLEKLLLLVPHGTAVTRALVEEISLRSPEHSSFELFHSMAARECRRATAITVSITNFHPLQICTMLNRAVRMTLARKVKSSEKHSDPLSPELAHQWIWRQIAGGEKAFDEKALRGALTTLQKLDLHLKSNALDEELALTCAAIEVCTREEHG